MKTLLATIFLFCSVYVSAQKQQGAWELQNGDTTTTMIIADDYLVMAVYTNAGKTFIMTSGGRINSYDGGISGVSEFNSSDKTLVGKEFKIQKDFFKKAKKIDNGEQYLYGNWRITQREQNGVLSPIHTTGPRNTIKILSATRFQWAAINTETGEFSGTGGGRYTLIDGKYTEEILFFSRDVSRVGMSLTFNAKLVGKDWYHSGKSSKGDLINEVWSRK